MERDQKFMSTAKCMPTLLYGIGRDSPVRIAGDRKRSRGGQ